MEMFKMLNKAEMFARWKIAYKRESKWKLSKDKEIWCALLPFEFDPAD